MISSKVQAPFLYSPVPPPQDILRRFFSVVIRAAMPPVMASKKFIYCALVSALGTIDSEKLKSEHFSVADYTVTFVSFPFAAFTVISLQFKDHTNTSVSWHSGRVPEEAAHTLMDDINEYMCSQACLE